EEDAREGAMLGDGLPQVGALRVAEHKDAAWPEGVPGHPAKLAISLFRQVVDQVEGRHDLGIPSQSHLEDVTRLEGDSIGETLLLHDLTSHRHGGSEVH